MWGHGIAQQKTVSNLARGAVKQELSSLWNDDFCWQISSLLEIFDSLALDACSHKIFVVLASGSDLKELAEEGRVYLAIYNLYNLNLRGTLLIWNVDFTAKSDKLSRWRKGPCPLFSSAKKYSSTWVGWWLTWDACCLWQRPRRSISKVCPRVLQLSRNLSAYTTKTPWYLQGPLQPPSVSFLLWFYAGQVSGFRLLI